MANEQNAQGEASLKSSTYKSRVSQRSKHSQKNPKAQVVMDQMPAASSEEATSKLVNELIGTLQVCNACSASLTEDERIINARFIQSAASNGQDISMFPICVKCNFE